METSSKITRREFVKTASVCGLGAAALSTLTMVFPNESAYAVTASDKDCRFDAHAHIQNTGDVHYFRANPTVGAEITTIGTTGKSLRMEALGLSIAGYGSVYPDYESLRFTYRAHVQNIGWQNWVGDNVIAGTKGRSLRMEAVQIQIASSLGTPTYNVFYRAHVQNLGWLPWVSNGAVAGTTGRSLRMEALQVVVRKKGYGI